MLIDLTQPVLHILVDECPEAFVVRTLANVKWPETGAIKSILESERSSDTVRQKVPVGAKLFRGNSVCYESCIPLWWVRPTITNRFEVATLAKRKEGLVSVLFELRVVHAEKWLIGIYSGPQMEEIAALSVKSLTASTADFPINRLGKINADEEAKFVDEIVHFRVGDEIWQQF